MKKSTIAVIVVLAALGFAVAVLLVLNHADTSARQQLRNDAILLIVHNDTEHRLGVADIEALAPADFEANYNRSGRPAEIRVFTGVPFMAILERLEIDPAGVDRAVFAASDGYQSALPVGDLPGVYIALCDERGPFRMVLPHDQFSQRWVHWLTDVTLR